MNELDETAQRAHDMIRFFREEYERQVRPYMTILAQIEALRPRVYVIDGETMVPFLPSVERRSGDA